MMSLDRKRRLHQRTAAYAWHRSLVEACRPYRATHATVLHAVAFFMRSRHGTQWYVSKANRRLVLNTLRRFGIIVEQ